MNSIVETNVHVSHILTVKLWCERRETRCKKMPGINQKPGVKKKQEQKAGVHKKTSKNKQMKC